MAEVVGSAGQAAGGLGGTQGAPAGLLPGAAVDALAEDPAASAGEEAPVRCGAVTGEVTAQQADQLSGMGTGRMACSGRCLRPRCSWLAPSLLQAAAVRGAVLARISFRPGYCFQDRLDLGFWPIIRMVSALSRRAAGTVDVLIVTSGRYRLADDSTSWPELALLAGPARVLPQEYPVVRVTEVDQDPSGLACWLGYRAVGTFWL